MMEQFERTEVTLSPDGLEDMRNDCLDMLNAIIWMLDGAKYLWANEVKNENAPAD